MSRIVVAIGTRPDVIKMRPVIDALRAEGFNPEIWWSGQGKDLNEATGDFPVDAVCGQVDWPSAAYGISKVIARFSHYLRTSGRKFTYNYDYDNPEQLHEVVEQPEAGPVDVVLVHGDDATAYACAVAAFLEEVPVAHVEAGLRTYASEPFPEEALRRMIGAVARWHFCPDLRAARNINAECALNDRGVYVVGNTINDTLPQQLFRVLATLHRRENAGTRILNALMTLGVFTDNNENVSMTVIRHPNWQGFMSAEEYSDHGADEHFCDPLSRTVFMEELQLADLIVTDSGGLQEECAWFGIPCLVVRSSTERTALVGSGAVKLIDPDKPEDLTAALDAEYAKRYVYGHGDTGKKIAAILKEELA